MEEFKESEKYLCKISLVGSSNLQDPSSIFDILHLFFFLFIEMENVQELLEAIISEAS